MNSDLAREWMLSALADLKSIQHIIHDEFLTHMVAFHAQQCVEKSFKAVLESTSSQVPKEHSTLKLYGLVRQEMNLQLETDILTDFDDLYIEARYPGNLGLLPQGKPTVEDAKEFHQFAQYIYAAVSDFLDIDMNRE